MLYKLTTTRDSLELLDSFRFDSDAPWGTEQDEKVLSMIKEAAMIGGTAALWDDRVQEPDENEIEYMADAQRQVWAFDEGYNIQKHAMEVLSHLKSDLELNLRQESEDIEQAIRIIYNISVMTPGEKEHIIGLIRERCAK